MNEFTPLPPEYNMAIGEFTPPMESFTDPSMEFSHTESAPQAAARPVKRKNTVKKLLAASTAVAASLGVMGGAEDLSRAFAPRQPREPVVVEEVITPGNAVETWTDTSWAAPAAPVQGGPAAEPTPSPTPEASVEPSEEPSPEPSQEPTETEGEIITPGDASEPQEEEPSTE